MLSLAFVPCLLLGLFASRIRAVCESYGVDYQNNGTYYLSANSTSQFQFTSLFEGCQQDVASNVLVAPNGTEYQCSNTPLTPDDVEQISDCPIEEEQLYTGEWSVLIISNNGDSNPIAYERDFSLIVSTPTTSTFLPTFTVSLTLPFTTFTFNLKGRDGTTTSDSTPITSPPATTTATTSTSATPVVVTATYSQSCAVTRTLVRDPTATITPTIVSAAALATPLSRRGFHLPHARDAQLQPDRAARLAERAARLDARQTTDASTPSSTLVTVTNLNSAEYPTITVTTYADVETPITPAPSVTITLSTPAFGNTAACTGQGGVLV